MWNSVSQKGPGANEDVLQWAVKELFIANAVKYASSGGLEISQVQPPPDPVLGILKPIVSGILFYIVVVIMISPTISDWQSTQHRPYYNHYGTCETDKVELCFFKTRLTAYSSLPRTYNPASAF